MKKVFWISVLVVVLTACNFAVQPGDKPISVVTQGPILASQTPNVVPNSNQTAIVGTIVAAATQTADIPVAIAGTQTKAAIETAVQYYTPGPTPTEAPYTNLSASIDENRIMELVLLPELTQNLVNYAVFVNGQSLEGCVGAFGSRITCALPEGEVMLSIVGEQVYFSTNNYYWRPILWTEINR